MRSTTGIGIRFGIVTMLVTIGSVGVYLYETTLDSEDDSEYYQRRAPFTILWGVFFLQGYRRDAHKLL